MQGTGMEFQVKHVLRSDLKVELIVKSLYFGNSFWVIFPIVLLHWYFVNFWNWETVSTMCTFIVAVLTCSTFFCPSLHNSRAFTTSQEHLKSSISVPIWPVELGDIRLFVGTKELGKFCAWTYFSCLFWVTKTVQIIILHHEIKLWKLNLWLEYPYRQLSKNWYSDDKLPLLGSTSPSRQECS